MLNHNIRGLLFKFHVYCSRVENNKSVYNISIYTKFYSPRHIMLVT